MVGILTLLVTVENSQQLGANKREVAIRGKIAQNIDCVEVTKLEN